MPETMMALGLALWKKTKELGLKVWQAKEALNTTKKTLVVVNALLTGYLNYIQKGMTGRMDPFIAFLIGVLAGGFGAYVSYAWNPAAGSIVSNTILFSGNEAADSRDTSTGDFIAYLLTTVVSSGFAAIGVAIKPEGVEYSHAAFTYDVARFVAEVVMNSMTEVL